jgi:hypothetical protein
MDIVTILHRTVENVMIRAFMDEAFRVSVGFDKISGPLGELPSWLLWLKERTGAYELELRSWKLKKRIGPSIGKEGDYWGRFTLRYFPHPEEPMFDAYSVYERIIRLSELFDDTGTPKYAERDTIDRSYFTVGNLECYVDTSEAALRMILEAPELWTCYREKGLAVWKNGTAVHVLQPGERDRNLPAWELCWFFFERLVTAFCYVNETPPCQVWLLSSPGTIFHDEGENVLRREYSWNHVLRRLEVDWIFPENPGERKSVIQRLQKSIKGKGGSLKKGTHFANAKGKPLPFVQCLYTEGRELPERGWEINRQFISREWWKQ